MRKPIKELYVDCVNYDSIHKDWSTGYGETWESYEATWCQECNKVVLGIGGEEQHKHIEEDTNCEGRVNTEGPMMNYFYPLPEQFERDWPDTSEVAKAIVNTNLCLVYFTDDDTYGLALTGGGMDLSWDICEAYMILGYCPPLFACDLPGLAGKKLNAKAKWIIAGCRKSCQASTERAKYTLRKLKGLRKTMAGK